jgi:predicted nuclease of predicted toxin-antitoxin system
VRLLVDAQLPPALARWLASQGHEAEHLADVGLLEASDSEVWEFARARRAVIVSKDEDFAQRRLLADDGPQILWVRTGNERRAALLARWARVWADAEVALRRGESLVEIS